ncbi:MAG: hypothetical protein WCS43_11040 [Verrucomicrobiota bacterium]
MKQLTEKQLHEALELLGALLEESGVSISLVVAGGSALLAQKITSRNTHDVDVIALDGGDTRAHPLPVVLTEAVVRVARELGLAPNWLNSSMSLFLGRDQLPELIWWSFDTRSYGSRLRVSFIRRDGLILLKLHAALDRNEPRDLTDLTALQPNEEETRRHLDWILKEILGQTTHPKLKDVLNHLDHGHLISRYQTTP